MPHLFFEISIPFSKHRYEMQRFATNPHAGGVGHSEHVSLESDVSETRAKPNPAKPLVSHVVNKGGRGVTTRVVILRDHYVLVERQQSRSATSKHTVDLRFVDPNPIGVRKVPWRLLYVAIGLTLLTAASIAMLIMLPNVAGRIGGLIAPLIFGASAIGCYVLCYFLTTESLIFLSVHGRARVVPIAGRLGTMRRARACAADVVTHVKIARKQFQQPRQSYLRDEMREHARLFEQSAFSERQYYDAKRRILGAHER
jgi:hypothetical protein